MEAESFLAKPETKELIEWMAAHGGRRIVPDSGSSVKPIFHLGNEETRTLYVREYCEQDTASKNHRAMAKVIREGQSVTYDMNRTTTILRRLAHRQ